ncbi:tRNA (pseudouridine(54)-N(1))-methyltransferase TrmY [Candidatus Woesearchaeota archaeon]|nr:tRNA (pseudouridine(54)-N(1))-methyltransferase TrmY [Candidatus Woesearchaeota archaeon]
MRTFILRARKSVTKPFDIDDLSSAGNMQVVASCIGNALWVSNNVRSDTVVHVVLEGPPTPPLTVTFYGAAIKDLPFDERGIAFFVNKAIKKSIKMGDSKEVSPGVMVSRKSFEEVVKAHTETSAVFYLHPKGKDVRSVEFTEDVTFVFGDYIGMPEKSESFLDKLGAERVTLGPVVLFASQCVTIVQNELDRRK